MPRKKGVSLSVGRGEKSKKGGLMDIELHPTEAT